jgi:hypothetical protein
MPKALWVLRRSSALQSTEIGGGAADKNHMRRQQPAEALQARHKTDATH